MSGPWLVAGLGNPGPGYASTRHNAGWMVVERLCARFGVRLREARLVGVHAAEASHDGQRLLLVTPAVFMNVSGPPIASFARRRGVPLDRVVVCHDDLDLPFGALRVKRGGSTAGHHGLDSLVQALHSPDFFRVRLGIGRPPGRQDPVDFVLEPFSARERDELDLLLEDAADAVLSLVTEGLGPTQSRFNRRPRRES